jgi:hypothetical protein
VTTTSPRASASPPGGAGDTWVDRLARFGLLGKGVVHVVIGLLALQIARTGSSSSEASASGTLRYVADLPFGGVALWVMGFSLLALAAWRAITTVTGDPVEDDDGWYRAVWAAKAVVYGGLAIAFLKAAIDGGSSGGSSDEGKATQATDTVFDWPLGRWIVVAAGLAVIGVAIHLIVEHAVHEEFVDRLRVSGGPAVTLGRVGYGLRSLAYLLVGALLVQAGLAGEEQRAKGLSGALESAADETWGKLLLFAVAAGFIAYGIYCFAEAKLRRSA